MRRFQDILLDTADNQKQDEANVNAECEDKHPPFKIPRWTPKRVRQNDDPTAQEAVNRLKSLSKVVTTIQGDFEVESLIFR
ncbi:unnamed protein product [Acanthoscelides obtectus]|uniref:Uncharacterized protein n=1 Tax=Acanthoscelides obtectus TaxID=200917 RepID=A0A9P0KTS2_ACAOB|nr:unnamed protein product [Acanthoscelides obtectus]CAK1633702.1 hypothetical protein AOBTE_LOCUS8329 [Acanthoscelides obtectus]